MRGQDENHQKRMMGEVAKLTDGADGKLDEAAYDADRQGAAGGQKIITKEPTGAWTHDDHRQGAEIGTGPHFPVGLATARHLSPQAGERAHAPSLRPKSNRVERQQLIRGDRGFVLVSRRSRPSAPRHSRLRRGTLSLTVRCTRIASPGATGFRKRNCRGRNWPAPAPARVDEQPGSKGQHQIAVSDAALEERVGLGRRLVHMGVEFVAGEGGEMLDSSRLMLRQSDTID